MASATATPQRRSTPRVEVVLPLTLARANGHGQPVEARTLDLSIGGARVAAERPLKVDELVRFDLQCGGGTHVTGECRVLREHVGRTYAVRFERVDDATALARVAAA